MKKRLVLLLMIMILFVVAACSDSSAEKVNHSEKSEGVIAEKEFDLNDVKDEKEHQYLVSTIEYFDANGTDLLIKEINKAEKVSTGDQSNENKVAVEVTLKEGFDNTPKGLLLPELILQDLVKNKFNETGISSINEVHLVVNAPVDGEETKVYEVEIDEESYEQIHKDGTFSISAIIDNATNSYIHNVYETEVFRK